MIGAFLLAAVTAAGGLTPAGYLKARSCFVFSPGWGRTVETGRVECVNGSDGWHLRCSVEFPAETKFTASYLELRFPSEYRFLELDGARIDLPEEKGKTPFLGTGKTSFAFVAPDGVKVTLSCPMSIEDARHYGGARYFQVRARYRRTVEGALAVYAADIPVSVEPTGLRVREIVRLPEGVPDFESPKVEEGRDWVKCDFARHTVPGSPLDFSFLKDETVKGRCYGGNFAWNSSMITHEESDRVADELVRMGYNWVRAHQHDTYELPNDDFDYFVAAMKKRGIKFTTDCYSSRKYKGELRGIKAALGSEPEAMEDWKAFTRKFLTHVNPYTGLALKDEPALICLNLVNEDNLDSALKVPKSQKTRAWRAEVGERQMAVHREMIRFCKEELGVKAPVTSLNMCSGADYAKRRSIFDLTDLHMYFAHPVHWDKHGDPYPHAFHSELGGVGQGMIMLGNFFERDWTKKTVVTEYRHCGPNVFRSESGALIGAYSALQGWDGMMGYGYAENANTFRSTERSWPNPFDTVNDAFSLMMDRVAELLYLRGDVSESRSKIAWEVPADIMKRTDIPVELPRTVKELGLLTGVGRVLEGVRPEGVRVCSYVSLTNAAAKLATQDVIVSDTKELSYDRKERVFKVVTPKSEVLLVSSGSAATPSLAAELVERGPCSLSCHSLDGKPLAESSKVLVFHLTDSAFVGDEFTDGLRRKLRKFGKGAYVLRNQHVKVRLPFAGRLTALKTDGSAAGPVAPEADGRHMLGTDLYPGAVLAYLLER